MTVPDRAWTDPTSVLLFVSKDSQPYREVAAEVLKGAQQEIPQTEYFQFTTQYLEQTAQPELNNFDLILAVGSRATEVAMKTNAGPPVLSILITQDAFTALAKKYFSSMQEAATAGFSAIYLDQPESRSFKLARLLIPDLSNAGVMLGPLSMDKIPSLTSELASLNIEAAVVAVNEKSNLIRVLEPVIRNVDAFIVLPDSRHLNVTTAKWILQLSFRYRVPVIGFSKAYVDAGALAAVYSSAQDVVRQTLERLRDQAATVGRNGIFAFPKYFSVEINRAVARNLGLNLKEEQWYENNL